MSDAGAGGQAMNDAGQTRACVAGDESALALVGAATFLETFAGVLDGAAVLAHCAAEHSAAFYREWIDAPRSAAWLATVAPGGAPVGYAVLAPSGLPVATPRDGDLELKRIYLLHRFQGSGLGRRLLDAATAAARALDAGRLLLGVYAGNTAAQAFYLRKGFVRTGDTRLFRVGGQDYADVIFARDLGGAG